MTDSVSSIRKGDLTELKSFSNPPPKVKAISEVICLMMGPDQTWQSFKKLAANPQKLMKSLLDYDKANASKKVKNKVKEFVDSTSVEEMKKVSMVGGSLYLYLEALNEYWNL